MLTFDKEIVIHCKPSALNTIKDLNLHWKYSNQFGKDEVDVITFDEDDLDEDQLVERLGLNYDLDVNCVELIRYI